MAKKANEVKDIKPRERKPRVEVNKAVDVKAITAETVNTDAEVDGNVLTVEQTKEPKWADHRGLPVIPVECIHELRFEAPNGELFYLDEYRAGDVYILRSV